MVVAVNLLGCWVLFFCVGVFCGFSGVCFLGVWLLLIRKSFMVFGRK